MEMVAKEIKKEGKIVILRCAVFMLLFFAGSGFAAPSFEMESGVKISSAAVYCVIPISNGYRMYFSSDSYDVATSSVGRYSVMSATSSDGISWTIEPGIRLSTQTNYLDSSSITAMGVYYDAGLAEGPYRAYYVGISSMGLYSILSATSSDGLIWGKNSDFSIKFDSGLSRVNSLAPYFKGSNNVILYYTRHPSSGTELSGMKVYYMQSRDKGKTFSGETLIFDSTGTYYITVSTLTNGNVRMFITAPLTNGTTGVRILSSESNFHGTYFGTLKQVFSTNSATNMISELSVVRATDTYSWRIYMTSKLANSTTSHIYSILASSPVIKSFSPNRTYIDDGPTDFSITGEIFSVSTPSVSLTKGADFLPVQSVTRISDIGLTVRVVPTNAALGYYNVTVTNTDGRYAVYSNALYIDYKPGYANMTDNLFRPLKGGKARVDVTIFYPGNVTAKVYTINGVMVRTLYNGFARAGSLDPFYWDGKTDNGNIAASGLYFLRVKGPKLDVTEKIVLIK